MMEDRTVPDWEKIDRLHKRMYTLATMASEATETAQRAYKVAADAYANYENACAEYHEAFRSTGYATNNPKHSYDFYVKYPPA